MNGKILGQRVKDQGKNTCCAVFKVSYGQALTLRIYPVKFRCNCFYSKSNCISSRTDDELSKALMFFNLR